MNRGRPTQFQQKNLQQNINWYYIHDISPETAAIELKIDRKTVYKHYKKLSDDIHTINQSNFFEEIKTKCINLFPHSRRD